MTIIQPYKKLSLVNILLIIFSGILVLSAITLVIVYNYVVNFEHRVEIQRSEIKKVETDVSEIKENLFNLLSSENLKKLAEQNGLVEEKSPEYLELNKNQWQIGLNL
jgi:cell division protein FtsL